jgi:hypothetical protein
LLTAGEAAALELVSVFAAEQQVESRTPAN